jgi:hypothetical protein
MDRLRGLGCAWDLPGIGGASRCGQLGHDFDLHVAVLQLPFVVLLEQHRADQPDNRGFIGENANNVGAALDFFVEPFQRVCNRYEDRGACSLGWDRLGSGVWCDHPGRGAPGAR